MAKENYDDFEEEFVEAASGKTINGKSLFARITDNNESNEYFKVVMRGFIWIFMLIVSLLALFLIFKTPYFTYYENKTPVVVPSQDKIKEEEYIDSNSVLKNNTTNNKESITQEFIEENGDLKSSETDKDNSSSQQLEVKSKNIASPDNQNTAVAPDTLENKKDSVLTTMLKQNMSEETVNNDAISNPDITEKPEVAAPRTNKQFSNGVNNNVKERRKTSDYVPLNEEDIKVTPSEPVTQKQALGNLVLEKPNDSTTEVNNKSVNSSTNNVTKTVLNTKPVFSKGWLVNIYSGYNKNDIYGKIKQLKKENNVLAGPDNVFYVVENKIKGGILYRISVAKNISSTEKPAFKDAQSARNYCNSLKSSNVDCFISEVDLATAQLYK